MDSDFETLLKGLNDDYRKLRFLILRMLWRIQMGLPEVVSSLNPEIPIKSKQFLLLIIINRLKWKNDVLKRSKNQEINYINQL